MVQRSAPPARFTRRTFLASGAAGLSAGVAGCGSVFDEISSTGREQLSVTITALPDDDDRQGNSIRAMLESHLEAVGVDVTIDLRTHNDLYRTVLIDNDFDIYVAPYRTPPSSDYLYELCHSRFENEPGWQNPFGITNLDLDELVENQRTQSDDEREATLTDAIELVLEEKPFVPICVPDDHYLVRSDDFSGWDVTRLSTPAGYLDLEPVGDADRLTGVTTDARPTLNLNPLAVDYRHRGVVTGLLYDSLAVSIDDELEPWLAEAWDHDGAELTATIRPNVEFHDGEPLTPSDVVFTYEFLADLSLGRAESAVPSPRFRRESTLVDAVERIDNRTVSFAVETTEELALDALTIPILPEHVWEPIVSDLDDETATTDEWLRDDLMDDGLDRIGSGPYVFDSRTERDELILTRFEEHFTSRQTVALPEATAAEIRILVAPNSSSAIAQVENGSATATVWPIDTHVVEQVDESEETALLETPSKSFYHLGFNARREPFGNPNFRQAVTALVDREVVVEEIFDGHATPIAAPPSSDVASSVTEWAGSDPVAPFAGTDGELDESTARDRFRDAGFMYDEEENLVVSN